MRYVVCGVGYEVWGMLSLDLLQLLLRSGMVVLQYLETIHFYDVHCI